MKYNFFYLTYIMQALIVLTAVYSFHIGYYAGTFFGLVAVGLSLIPTLVHRKMHIVVPWEITFLIALTLFLHIGGYSYHWYLDLYPYYDKVAHLVASMTVALLGFLAVLIIMRVSNCLQFERWQIFFFIVIFTLAFGAIWKIWEFSMDSLAGAYLTKPLQHSNTDTMIDLITDLCERQQDNEVHNLLVFSFSFEEQFALETGKIFRIEPFRAHFCDEICYHDDHRENVNAMPLLIPGLQKIFFSVE